MKFWSFINLPWGSAVLTFIGYKQTNTQTNRQAKFIYRYNIYVHCTYILYWFYITAQGPPGTGKSFLGSLLVQVLLENRSLWTRTSSTPVLVICYTNAALGTMITLEKRIRWLIHWIFCYVLSVNFRWRLFCIATTLISKYLHGLNHWATPSPRLIWTLNTLGPDSSFEPTVKIVDLNNKNVIIWLRWVSWVWFTVYPENCSSWLQV